MVSMSFPGQDPLIRMDRDAFDALSELSADDRCQLVLAMRCRRPENPSAWMVKYVGRTKTLRGKGRKENTTDNEDKARARALIMSLEERILKTMNERERWIKFMVDLPMGETLTDEHYSRNTRDWRCYAKLRKVATIPDNGGDFQFRMIDRRSADDISLEQSEQLRRRGYCRNRSQSRRRR